MAWCCESDDIERIARRLGLALERGARERPDGSRLSWRLAGRDAGLGARPFFIAWDSPEMRPGLLSAPHAIEVQGIDHVEVGCSREAAGRVGRGRRAPRDQSATTGGCARS